MSVTPAFLAHAQRQGEQLAARVLSRDNLHLHPARLSKAAVRRLRAGLRALQAYLRRLLLVMALALEPDLRACPRERVHYHRPARPCPAPTMLAIFTAEHALPDAWTVPDPWADTRLREQPGPVLAAPLLAQLGALQALLAAPETRARKLAFHLARARPGPLLAPDLYTRAVPARFGTEISALYRALAAAIAARSRDRPAPLGPGPRAPPRIRRL